MREHLVAVVPAPAALAAVRPDNTHTEVTHAFKLKLCAVVRSQHRLARVQ